MATAAKQMLMRLAMNYDWDYAKVVNELIEKTKAYDVTELDIRINDWLKNHKALAITDSEYPDKWKGMSNPPIIVEYDGDISILKNRTYVGTDDQDLANELTTKHEINTLYVGPTGITFRDWHGEELWVSYKGMKDKMDVVGVMCDAYVLTNDDDLSEKVRCLINNDVKVRVKLDSLKDKRAELLRNENISLYIDEKDVDI